MKKAKKILTLVACAVLLVCISVGATIAYLTSVTDVVNNTFTVGHVEITLDEKKVDVYGVEEANADRVIENEYKLIANHNYTKDPTVHVEAGSEPCYVYVRVVNEIADIEVAAADGDTIAEQMTTNGWVAVGEAYPNVYYYDANTTDEVVGTIVDALNADAAIDLVVFEDFTIKASATEEDLTAYAKYEQKDEEGETVLDEDGNPVIIIPKKITIKAYALQSDGFADAVKAYTAAPCDWEE